MSLTIDQLVAASFDSAPDPTIVLNDQLGYECGNQAWLELSKNDGEMTAPILFHPRCLDVPEDMAAEITKGILGTLNSSATFARKYSAISDGRSCRFLLRAHRMQVGADAFTVVSRRDITMLPGSDRASTEIEMQTALWAAVVRSTKDAILTYSLDGLVTTWNRGAEALYEYTAEEMIGTSLERLYPKNWPTKITEYRDQILSGELVNFEAIRVTKSGSERTVAITGAPVLSSTGKVIGVSNIHRDITNLRKEEEARAIKAQEAVHRSKNLMAVVIAIQRQIAKSSATVPEMTEKFAARISSLSQSTDLLVRDDYARVPLMDVVKAQLSLFESDATSAVTLSGPDILLEPQATQTLGMIVFELLTNALKYGALSANRGKVDLNWDVASTSEGSSLHISWSENGGPIITPPKVEGFGTTVLTRLASATLNGTADMKFQNSGLQWSLTFGNAHFAT